MDIHLKLFIVITLIKISLIKNKPECFSDIIYGYLISCTMCIPTTSITNHIHSDHIHNYSSYPHLSMATEKLTKLYRPALLGVSAKSLTEFLNRHT